MKNLLLTLMLMSLLVQCTMQFNRTCMQGDLIQCKALSFCPDRSCVIYNILGKPKEKKKPDPYSKADLLAHFSRFRITQENIVKKMERQMKELKGIEKGAAELTKQ